MWRCKHALLRINLALRCTIYRPVTPCVPFRRDGCYKVDIIESARYNIRMKGVPRHFELPRYWATSKVDPKNLILACSRKEELLYHEEVSDEEDEKDYSNNKKDVEEETDDYTDRDDEDELKRPKTTKARGRSKSIDADQTIYSEADTATGSEDDTSTSA